MFVFLCNSVVILMLFCNFCYYYNYFDFILIFFMKVVEYFPFFEINFWFDCFCCVWWSFLCVSWPFYILEILSWIFRFVMKYNLCFSIFSFFSLLKFFCDSFSWFFFFVLVWRKPNFEQKQKMPKLKKFEWNLTYKFITIRHFVFKNMTFFTQFDFHVLF